MRLALVVIALLSFAACNRDPNVAKVRYLENGNKYFEKAKYKEAAIMYRNALQKDLRFGPAHYKLALTELKLGRLPQAVAELLARRPRRTAGPAPRATGPISAAATKRRRSPERTS